MTQELMSRYEARWSEESATMQIYCFSNYQQGPELDIYTLPANVFRFLSYVWERQFQEAWKEIVRSGYVKMNWNKVESENDYKNYTNLVYERLLIDRSIIQFFINPQERKARGNWELISIYLKEVRRMNENRLNIIKRVGDDIAESIQQSGKIRRLLQLERAGNYRELRNILRFIIKDRIYQRQPEPLFSLDEYTEYLFPEASGEFTEWTETRDIIVFRIYETLHNWLTQRELPEIEEEITEEVSEAKED